MIPLYATEDEIAALVFGRGRLREWRAFATIQERKAPWHWQHIRKPQHRVAIAAPEQKKQAALLG